MTNTDNFPFKKIIGYVGPWGLFGLFLIWGWRVYAVFDHLPAYGDALEVIWGMQWYYDGLIKQQQHTSPLYTSLVFHPNGWHTASLAHTPFFFLISLPLYTFGGTPFAYNFLAVTALFVAFGGVYRAARFHVSAEIATVAAVVYTFSNPVWLRLGGHLNILWGMALMPWLLWLLLCLAKYNLSRKYLIIIGLLWGVMINFSQYFVFLGGILIAVYVIIFSGGDSISQRLINRLKILISISSIAFIISLPVIFLFLQARSQDNMIFWDLFHINSWALSLNNIFIPSVMHPWLKPLVQQIYNGPIDESSTMNLGLITGLLVLLNVRYFRWERKTGLLFILMAVGLILGLGFLLKYNGKVIEAESAIPVNQRIWDVGYNLKPSLFDHPLPHGAYKQGLPLPGFVLVAVLPLWEGVRTVSRFALLATLASVLLAAISLNCIKYAPVRYFIIVLWLLEFVPPPYKSELPMPIAHPAHKWLASQAFNPRESIADFQQGTLPLEGPILYATSFHKKPTISGAGSQWPAHVAFFRRTFDESSIQEASSAFMLRSYGIRYILYHMPTGLDQDVLSMLDSQESLQRVNCFEKPRRQSPWNYPICIFEVIPEASSINLFLNHGWAKREAWGVWATGLNSHAIWIAASQKDYHLRLEAFPHCISGQNQTVAISLNGHLLDTYLWESCDAWQRSIFIPSSLVEIGWNKVDFLYAFASRPNDAGNDQRELAVGFTRLELED